MNEDAEQALARAANHLGEYFSEFVIICAQKASREPIIDHSGSVFAAKGLTDAAAYQLDTLGKCDDDEDDNWRDDEDHTGGDPKIPA